ncbi:hypothetical protein EU527_11905 [Candidatus Thorarchaeota archaeon]|nr:MAG: hypothetical protein EU527_11905 [Candidatus Thorarchaeota archaeon]
MSKRLSWLREYLSLLSKKALKRWMLIVLAISTFFFVMNTSHSPGPLDLLFAVSASIGWVIVIGLPFLLGASLLFSSELTQNNIAEKASKEKIRFLPLFIVYLILMSLSITIIALIGVMVVPLILGNPSIIQYLPQVLGLSIIISVLIAPIYLLLALSVDNVRLAVLFGLAASFAVIIAFGQPRYPVNYPEIAFLEPAHLLSALLFVSIGAYGQYAMDYYVGTMFGLIHLVLPFGVLVILFFVGYFGSKVMFLSNLPRWSLEWDDWILRNKTHQEIDSQTRSVKLLAAQQSLDLRRKKVMAVAIGIIIVIPFAFTSYVQVRQQEWTQVVYESPSGGETLTIGEWTYGSFIGVEPSPSIYLCVGCSGRILNWEGGSGYIEYTFQHRAMTLLDFQKLNETEFDDLFGHSWGSNHGTTGQFGGGCGGPIGNKDYVWVLKFIDVNGKTSGSINVWFQVMIRAH